MKKIILLFIFIWIGIGFYAFRDYEIVKKTTPSPTAIPTPTPVPHVDSYKLYDLVNEYRANNNLNKLVFDPKLCPLAEERLSQIKTDWSHDQFPSTRYKHFAYGTVSENLAKEYQDNDSTFNGWINSPSHLQNIEDTRHTNTCIVTRNNYAVQIFSSF